MNASTVISAIVTSLCGVGWGAALLVLIVASWREARRGRKVALWSDDAARMRALLGAGASPTVAQHILQGNKINAIKECRIETGLGLKDAKDAVERYERALYRYEPWVMRGAR